MSLKSRQLKQHLKNLPFDRPTTIFFVCKVIKITNPYCREKIGETYRYKLEVLNMKDHQYMKHKKDNMIFYTNQGPYTCVFIDTFQFDKSLVIGNKYAIRCGIGYNNKHQPSFKIKRVLDVYE